MKARSVSRSVLSFTILFLLITVTICSMMSIFPFVGKVKAQVAVLGVYPKISSRNPGEFLTIRVNVTGVTDLYTWSFQLGWERGLLNCIQVSEETGFFDGDFAGVIDNPNARVSVGSTYFGGVPGETGGGRLARIRFEVTDGGNCTLDLFNTNMVNSTGDDISHSVEDGIFYTTVPKAQFTYSPDPSDEEHPEYHGHPIVNEVVTFNATTSYDPDQIYGGQPVNQTYKGIDNYQWEFDDGTFGSGNITTHVYDTAGTYFVRLTVTDDEFEVDDYTYPSEGLRIKLHAIAVINVTSPPEVTVGSTVLINATIRNYGSDTASLNVTAYAWTGGSTLHIVNNTLFTYQWWDPHQGRWRTNYSLTAGDTQTATMIWDTTGFQEGPYIIGVKAFFVTPPNTPGLPPLEYRPDLEADISDNEMADGTVTLTGEPEHDMAVTHINVEPTDLELPAKPEDPNEWAIVEVTVENQGNTDEHFNATITAYRDGAVFQTKAFWNRTIPPGATEILEMPLLEGTDDTEEGNYNITASVSIVNATTLEEIPDLDTTDNMMSDLFEIRLLPVAAFTHSPSSPSVGQEVTFGASASYAPGANGGTIKSYKWDFGDGTVVEGNSSTTTHVYRWSATFRVTLTVTDDVGLTSSITKSGPTGVRVTDAHDLTITDVSFSPHRVPVGDSVDILVAIRNTGGFQEAFNVTVYYGSTEISTQSNITLASDADTTLTFVWATSNVAAGDYVIKANATTVAGETHIEDNLRVGGTVTVEKLSSSITVSASLTLITPGETVTIEGAISPVRAGVEVTIWDVSDGGSPTLLATVTTNANGQYTHTWTPPEAESYAVRASWAGDDLTSSSDSAPQIVTVQEPPGPDIFLYTTGALAGVVVVLLVYFLMFRKPKP